MKVSPWPLHQSCGHAWRSCGRREAGETIAGRHLLSTALHQQLQWWRSIPFWYVLHSLLFSALECLVALDTQLRTPHVITYSINTHWPNEHTHPDFQQLHLLCCLFSLLQFSFQAQFLLLNKVCAEFLCWVGRWFSSLICGCQATYYDVPLGGLAALIVNRVWEMYFPRCIWSHVFNGQNRLFKWLHALD